MTEVRSEKAMEVIFWLRPNEIKLDLIFFLQFIIQYFNLSLRAFIETKLELSGPVHWVLK